MANWLYPYETNTSTFTEKTVLGKRKRQVFLEESFVQKVVQRYRIELQDFSPDDPDIEFSLQIARDVLTCAPTFCGSAKVARQHPRTGHTKEHHISERFFSVWLEDRIYTRDGSPELQCTSEKNSVHVEYHFKQPLKFSDPSRLRAHEDSSTSSEGEDESEDTNDSEYEEKSEDTDEEEVDKKDIEDNGESGRCPDARLKFVRHLSGAPATITFTVCMERTFLDRQWTSFRSFKAPEPKSALLRDAENDGDVYLLAKDGTKVAAQSAVLMKVPYFSALLEPHWKRKRQLRGQKLELDLPCPVDQDALQIFLNYVYGDTGPLFRTPPLHAQLLQDILRLADACDVPALCSEIDSFASVTKENAQLWLQWLREMRGSNIELSSIRKEMVGQLKQVFSEAVMWEDLDDDQLAALVAFGHDLKKRDS